jgi:pyruvate dehydrogenase E1 component
VNVTYSASGPLRMNIVPVDSDPTETREWVESLEGVISEGGTDRAAFLLHELEDQLRRKGVRASVQPYSAYRNTIPLHKQGAYPGDLAIEERITSVVRWNALAMVVRANQAYGELGGHIASYASAAEIFEMGFNHFFRADSDGVSFTNCWPNPSVNRVSDRIN